MAQSKEKSNRLKFWLYLAIICLIVAGVYAPSLWHLFRGETYIYFLNTQGDSDFVSLVRHTYNYEVVSQWEVGDVWLFRPLGYAILAVEKSLFGFNYFWWRVVALLVHLAVVACLFRLMWFIKRGILAVVLTLLFGTLYVSVNAILYLQIMPYSLFLAIILLASYYLYRRKEVIALSLLFVSSFLYEMGFVFMLVIGAYLIWKNRIKWWLAPIGVVAYLLAYFIPKILSGNPMLGGDLWAIVNFNGISYGIAQIPNIAGMWLLQTAMPTLFGLIPVGNLRLQSAGITSLPINGWVIFNIIVLLAMGFVLYRSQKSKRARGIIGLLAVVFIMVVSVFRSSSRGVAYILDTNFDANIFMALIIVWMYGLLAARTMNGRYAFMLPILVLVITTISAGKTLQLNYELMGMEEGVRIYLQYPQLRVAEIDDTMPIDVRDKNGIVRHFTIPQILEGK